MERIKMNITEYIKNNDRLSNLDFLQVYLTIVELLNDDKMKIDDYVSEV